jgi:UDP-glucose 4-epimerase
MTSYLVTGGAGFIGSNLVDKLLQRGDKVRVLDNLSTGHMENVAAVRDRIDFLEADICNLEQIRPCFAGVDYVLHMAALPSVPRSVADPLSANKVNIEGTLNVLLASRDAKVKRVVFAASSAAYGDNPILPRVESHPPRPMSPYALTKVAGEYYCQVFANIYGLETVALRFFNIFGPRQDPHSQYTGVLSKFITAYIKGTTPTIFGDGEQSRDFTYIDNVVDANLRACTAPGAPGKVINVGVGGRFTLNQTIGLLNQIFGKQVTPRYEPPRRGDVLHSQADMSLARQVLGYEPRVTYEQGLRKTVEWYVKNLGA